MSGKFNFTKTVALCLIAYFALTFIYRISAYIGCGSSKECGFAIIVIVGSWIISLLPYPLVDRNKLNGFVAVFLISSAIRILLTCLLIVWIIKNWDLRQNFLLIWASIFYFILLIVDTYFNMKYLKDHDWTKKDFFADKENEIYISYNESSGRDSE